MNGSTLLQALQLAIAQTYAPSKKIAIRSGSDNRIVFSVITLHWLMYTAATRAQR